MVEHPQRVDAGDPRVVTGLPVDPPEVDAVVLQPPVQDLEVGPQELRIGDVKGDRRLGLGAAPQRHRHLRIGVLERTHAIGRMHVEGDVQPLPVQLGQEGGRVGEEVAVPAVARPTAAVTRIDPVDRVPVHVQHGDRERHVVGLETFHQFEVGLGGVGVVAAPPVAQSPARQHGLLP